MIKIIFKKIMISVAFLTLCSLTWAAEGTPERMMPPGQGTGIPEGVDLPAQAKI